MLPEVKQYEAYLLAETVNGRETVVFASPACCQVLEMTEDQLVGSDPALVRPEKLLGRVSLPGGKTLHMLVGPQDAPAMDEIRRINFDLERALQAANAAVEAKSSFLSNMSHDIRTPMNAIIGMTSIAQNHLDEKARVADCLDKINTASQHLMSLINDVLDMSRIESGKTTISEERFSLADLVHDLAVLLRPLAEAKQQALTLDVADIEHESLMGDALYLRQVFVNIINNAVKYTEEGGDIRVRFSERPGSDPLQVILDFTCQDNGIGMSPEFLQRIFLPFERAGNTTVSRIEGTGLGMAITKSLIEQMGGTITVESELGKGSTFTVSLPLSVTELAEDKQPLAGATVLVVESDEALAGLMAKYIREAGGEAEVSSSGTEAVSWVTHSQVEGKLPDAVLLGGKANGNALLNLATHLRGQLSDSIPIFLVSEEDWAPMEYAAQRAGVTGFIPCPLFKGRLLEALVAAENAGNGSEAEKISFEGMHLLLVEDNELNREIALELLAEIGIQADSAENGKVALETFEASEEGYYDMILMDIQMPVMDGFESARRIRALPRADASTVCIAAMTANAFVEDVKKTRAAGMDEHLSKPVDIARLEELLRKYYHR